MFAHSNKTFSLIKQKLMELQEIIHSNSIIMGDSKNMVYLKDRPT